MFLKKLVFPLLKLQSPGTCWWLHESESLKGGAQEWTPLRFWRWLLCTPECENHCLKPPPGQVVKMEQGEQPRRCRLWTVEGEMNLSWELMKRANLGFSSPFWTEEPPKRCYLSEVANKAWEGWGLKKVLKRRWICPWIALGKQSHCLDRG